MRNLTRNNSGRFRKATATGLAPLLTAILVKLADERSGSRALVNIGMLALVATIALAVVAWYALYHGWGENHGTMFAYDSLCANLSLLLISTAIMCLVDARRCLKAEEAARVSHAGFSSGVRGYAVRSGTTMPRTQA